MKYLSCIVCGLALFFLASCSSKSSPLVLTLELAQKEILSFEDIQCQVVLTNQSDSSLLVNKRLFTLPFPAHPQMAEMLILISDSEGNLVDNNDQTFRYEFPNKGMLNALRPDERLIKHVYLSVGFWPSLFKKGEKYTIVAIYQNEIDVTKTIGGVEVPSWIGSVRSNEETFVILP